MSPLSSKSERVGEQGCSIKHGMTHLPCISCRPGVGNLRHAGQMQPACTFYMARIRIFVTHVRTKHRVKMKVHDKQVLRQV